MPQPGGGARKKIDLWHVFRRTPERRCTDFPENSVPGLRPANLGERTPSAAPDSGLPERAHGVRKWLGYGGGEVVRHTLPGHKHRLG